MKLFLEKLKTILCDRSFHEFLWFCVPAVLIGLILRVYLTLCLPYGYYQVDSADLLMTPARWFSEGEWRIHSKKVFLTPFLYTLPFLLKVPALIVIPLSQHLLGLLLPVLFGGLCRLWFVNWKWWIIPVTVLVAIHPSIIWFEHALMAEFHYVFFATLAAVTGTLYCRWKSWPIFITFLIALFLTAGSRPEGKLFFGFAILLVTYSHWKEWRTLTLRLAIVLIVTLGTHRITKTSQSGLLLYCSLLKYSPNVIHAAPGFAEKIQPVRDFWQAQWKGGCPTYLSVVRKQVSPVVKQYLSEHPEFGSARSDGDASRFCLKISLEICRQNLIRLPELAWCKFLASLNMMSSFGFDEFFLIDRQFYAMRSKIGVVQQLKSGLTGWGIDDEGQAHQFIKEYYSVTKVKWFHDYQYAWQKLIGAQKPEDPRANFTSHRTLPWFYGLAFAGMLLVLLCPQPHGMAQISWLCILVSVWFMVFLTANLGARFRFVFEPFFLFYAFLALDRLSAFLKKEPKKTATA